MVVVPLRLQRGVVVARSSVEESPARQKPLTAPSRSRMGSRSPCSAGSMMRFATSCVAGSVRSTSLSSRSASSNWLRSRPMSFWQMAVQLRARFSNQPEPSPSYTFRSPIRLVLASSRAWLTLAGTLPASRTLSMDGTHIANIALLGSYMASTFAAASDGHGGTLISEAAQTASQTPLLTQPHA
jgi:hypothetical protein